MSLLAWLLQESGPDPAPCPLLPSSPASRGRERRDPAGKALPSLCCAICGHAAHAPALPTMHIPAAPLCLHTTKLLREQGSQRHALALGARCKKGPKTGGGASHMVGVWVVRGRAKKRCSSAGVNSCAERSEGKAQVGSLGVSVQGAKQLRVGGFGLPAVGRQACRHNCAREGGRLAGTAVRSAWRLSPGPAVPWQPSAEQAA